MDYLKDAKIVHCTLVNFHHNSHASSTGLRSVTNLAQAYAENMQDQLVLLATNIRSSLAFLCQSHESIPTQFPSNCCSLKEACA